MVGVDKGGGGSAVLCGRDICMVPYFTESNEQRRERESLLFSGILESILEDNFIEIKSCEDHIMNNSCFYNYIIESLNKTYMLYMFTPCPTDET